MTSPFAIRRATAHDAAVIARHRAEMFSDMGQLPVSLYDDLTTRTVAYLRDAIPRDEYRGWLAAEANRPESIVAGAGVQLRRTLPHPLTRDGASAIAHGHQAIVLNVFTEKSWRRKGLAALLMRHILDWASTTGLDTWCCTHRMTAARSTNASGSCTRTRCATRNRCASSAYGIRKNYTCRKPHGIYLFGLVSNAAEA